MQRFLLKSPLVNYSLKVELQNAGGGLSASGAYPPAFTQIGSIKELYDDAINFSQTAVSHAKLNHTA